MANWKLKGIILSQIITDLRSKPIALNQRFTNEYSVKSNNRRIQTKVSCGTRIVRGGWGHQGRSERGGRGGRGRGVVRRNYDWEITGLNGCTIRVHPAYRF